MQTTSRRTPSSTEYRHGNHAGGTLTNLAAALSGQLGPVLGKPVNQSRPSLPLYAVRPAPTGTKTISFTFRVQTTVGHRPLQRGQEHLSTAKTMFDFARHRPNTLRLAPDFTRSLPEDCWPTKPSHRPISRLTIRSTSARPNAPGAP